MPRESNNRKAARVAAVRAAAGGSNREGKQCAEDSQLQLQLEDADAVVRRLAGLLRRKRPDLSEDLGEEASAPNLAAAFTGFASAEPQTFRQWCSNLAEVLGTAGAALDEDDNDSAVRWVIRQLVGLGLLTVLVRPLEEGDVVLAVLEEDDSWHEAVVEGLVSSETFRLVFLEYNKPQDTPSASIRRMDDVVDDEGAELQEGDCEMCGRRVLLSFHHLIPKDTHPTYLKRRLPPGVEGEPTRSFLNTYGTMVCGKCHGFIHRLASNEVLAKDYNTLPKILEHPLVQRWVRWLSQQRGGPR